MKVSGRIVSILLAVVVVLFAFLLLSTVGGKRRDGFQEGAKPAADINRAADAQAKAININIKKATTPPPANTDKNSGIKPKVAVAATNTKKK